ncbi:restriction endonuclease subunit S [Desulforhopalus sp. 52FAK]
MKTVQLGDICTVVSGSTPKRAIKEYWGGDIPWVAPKEISSLEGAYLNDSKEKITAKGLKSCSATMLPKGSLLLSSRAPIGLLAINNIPVCTNQGFKSLIPSEGVHVQFLYYYLKSNVKSLQYKGAGATFKELSKAAVERFVVHLPNFDDQIRIATLLSRVEALIATRKENLCQLKEFLTSTFLEMFGDPVRNEKGWATADCHKVVIGIKSGTSYGGEDRSALKDNEMGVLKISAVTQGFFNANEFKAVDRRKIKKQVITVKKGDFLISRANTYELVAACCVVDKSNEKLFLPDKLWRLSFDEKRINSQFFNYLLKNNSFRNIVRKQASGGHESMLNISMEKFRQLRVIVPDKFIQDKFANIEGKVGNLRKHYQQNLVELENLYGVLSQKAFKGDLDLSNIPTEGVDSSNDTEEKITSVLPLVEVPGEKMPHINALTSIDSNHPELQHEYGLPSIDFMVGENKAEEDDKDIDIANPSIRKKYVSSLLSTYLSGQKGGHFSMDDFSSLIDDKFEQLSTDENQILMDVVDYDSIRNSLFQLLENGQIEQKFNETSNKVELKIK